MKDRATHQGHCQACGRIQRLPLGILAKHGYTVDWGFFNGVCCGSDRKPLESDKSVSESIIKALRTVVAPKAQRVAADLRSGVAEPRWTKLVGSKRVEVTRVELSDYDQGQQIAGAAHRADSEARHALAHANDLEKLIEAVHGKPLIEIKDEVRKELKPGVKVRIGGAKGEVYEVVEVKHQVARGCGPHLNGQYILHAFFTSRKTGQLFAVPARTIRQDAIVG
jgi:hypothetical protein